MNEYHCRPWLSLLYGALIALLGLGALWCGYWYLARPLLYWLANLSPWCYLGGALCMVSVSLAALGELMG
jgi:hypothetical protein